MLLDTQLPFETILSSHYVLITALTISFLFIIFQTRRKRKEFRLQRQFYIICGLTLFFFTITKLFLVSSDIERWISGESVFFFQLVYFGYLFAYFACLAMLYYFDRFIINPDRIIITKIILGYAIFCSFIVFISPALSSYFWLVRYLLYLGFYLTAIIFGIMMIKILATVKVKVNKKLIAFGSGLILAIVGQAFGTDILNYYVYSKAPMMTFFPTGLTIIGLILIVKNLDFGFDIILLYYTTKKICIIHRGEITKDIQLCPNCLSTYCLNCFNSVILQEKKCWFCDFHFGEEKPSESMVSMAEQDETENLDEVGSNSVQVDESLKKKKKED
ncbi:MAG: hypothetical protein ACFFCS_03540 [Candidatus Hodarchaeota archaeon]